VAFSHGSKRRNACGRVAVSIRLMVKENFHHVDTLSTMRIPRAERPDPHPAVGLLFSTNLCCPSSRVRFAPGSRHWVRIPITDMCLSKHLVTTHLALPSDPSYSLLWIGLQVMAQDRPVRVERRLSAILAADSRVILDPPCRLLPVILSTNCRTTRPGSPDRRRISAGRPTRLWRSLIEDQRAR
jgi:hypothetical protein